jgi:hypothetical protein
LLLLVVHLLHQKMRSSRVACVMLLLHDLLHCTCCAVALQLRRQVCERQLTGQLLLLLLLLQLLDCLHLLCIKAASGPQGRHRGPQLLAATP